PAALPPFPTRRSSDLRNEQDEGDHGGRERGDDSGCRDPGRAASIAPHASNQTAGTDWNGPHPLDETTREVPAHWHSLDALTPAVDRKSTRLNSSHVKI